VHGRNGGEDRSAFGRRGERPDDDLDPNLLGRPAELREIDLGEQDVVGAGGGQQLERARIDLVGVVDRPRIERVAGHQVVRELGR
jgi:hypothetical protein